MRRRAFLRMGLLGAAGKLFGQHLLKLAPAAPSKSLAPFVDCLPVPPVIRPGAVPLRIPARRFLKKVHRDLPPTALWGYNGTWPGPTLEVRRDHAVSVHWKNELPAKHFLPLDHTIHGCGEGLPQVRIVTHLHGAQVLPESDGHPEAWIATNRKTGRAYHSATSHYPNRQAAATLWYHDHTLGITRLNIYAGLAGFYLIRDAQEAKLNLPSGAFEIPLMIQDRSFNTDGSLFYPIAEDGPHPVWIQEFFGDNICVNGKVTPYLEVEPRKYRFRLLNASNSRFYTLKVEEADATGKSSGKPGLPFHQIGSDVALLPAPVELKSLTFGPGERADVVLDFTGHKGANFALLNSAPAPYDRGGANVPAEVMLFKVTKPPSSKDESSLPQSLVSVPAIDPASATRERMLSLTEIVRASDGYTVVGFLGGKGWDDPITEDPNVGSTEIWSFANSTDDVHSIHTHLVHFQVLDRQPFDVKTYRKTGNIDFTGPRLPPAPNERPAWKDTVQAPPNYVTRVIQKFDLPAGTKALPGQEFHYVWHCHMLEHEDNEMMRPYKLIV